MRTFKLKTHMPTADAGTLFIQSTNGNGRYNYKMKDMDSGQDRFDAQGIIGAKYVENNPEFFEEVGQAYESLAKDCQCEDSGIVIFMHSIICCRCCCKPWRVSSSVALMDSNFERWQEMEPLKQEAEKKLYDN